MTRAPNLNWQYPCSDYKLPVKPTRIESFNKEKESYSYPSVYLYFMLDLICCLCLLPESSTIDRHVTVISRN